MMLSQEKAGARYYVLSLALLLELIHPHPCLPKPEPRKLELDTCTMY